MGENVQSKVAVESSPKTDSPKQESERKEAEEAQFFHPVQLSVEGVETLNEEEIEKSRVEIEQKLQELLKGIDKEASQLSEFLAEENKLVNDLCVSLKQVLKKLNISFNIPPENIPSQKKIKKAVLNEEGHLKLVYEKGDGNSAFLAEYPPEIVMAVLWVILPELARAIMLYRKKMSARVSFFGKLKNEMKTIVKAIVEKEEILHASNENQKQG